MKTGLEMGEIGPEQATPFIVPSILWILRTVNGTVRSEQGQVTFE